MKYSILLGPFHLLKVTFKEFGVLQTFYFQPKKEEYLSSIIIIFAIILIKITIFIILIIIMIKIII
jgi:hypothetical protein